MISTFSCLIQVLMQISKIVLVKSTAVYDSLLREWGQEVAMPLIESQLIAIGEHDCYQGLGRLMAICKILPSWDHWEKRRTASYSWSVLLSYKLIRMWGLSSPLKSILFLNPIKCIGLEHNYSNVYLLPGGGGGGGLLLSKHWHWMNGNTYFHFRFYNPLPV